MKKNTVSIKYLHVLPADVDNTYWFIRMMEHRDDYVNHSFLIAANRKTVFTRYTRLLEFPELLFLVGGTEGKDAKRRYAALQDILSSAENVIWHSVFFDTLDMQKLLKNKSLAKKSTWVCNNFDYIELSNVLNVEKPDKKVRWMKKILPTINRICIESAQQEESLKKLLALGNKTIFFTPYVIDPDFFKESKKILSEQKDESLLPEAEQEKSIPLLPVNKDENKISVLFDFSIYSPNNNLVIAKDLKKLSTPIRFVIPKDIWLDGTKIVRSKSDKRFIALMRSSFDKDAIFLNASFKPKSLYSFFDELDAILITTDFEIKPIYLYAAIMANKTFIVSENNPYYAFLKEIGCTVIALEAFPDESISASLSVHKEQQPLFDAVEPYFDVQRILAFWNPLFE